MAKATKGFKAAEVEASVGDTVADVAVEAVVDQHITETLTGGAEEGISVVQLTGLLNTETNMSHAFTNFEGHEIDVVTLDNVTLLDGKEIGFGKETPFSEKEKKFVPSFDQKEEGKWIANWTKKTDDGKVKLKASFDASTKVLKLDGERFERATVRVYFK